MLILDSFLYPLMHLCILGYSYAGLPRTIYRKDGSQCRELLHLLKSCIAEAQQLNSPALARCGAARALRRSLPNSGVCSRSRRHIGATSVFCEAWWRPPGGVSAVR